MSGVKKTKTMMMMFDECRKLLPARCTPVTVASAADPAVSHFSLKQCAIDVLLIFFLPLWIHRLTCRRAWMGICTNEVEFVFFFLVFSERCHSLLSVGYSVVSVSYHHHPANGSRSTCKLAEKRKGGGGGGGLLSFFLLSKNLFHIHPGVVYHQVPVTRSDT